MYCTDVRLVFLVWTLDLTFQNWLQILVTFKITNYRHDYVRLTFILLESFLQKIVFERSGGDTYTYAKQGKILIT